jgi:hypothetical protein
MHARTGAAPAHQGTHLPGGNVARHALQDARGALGAGADGVLQVAEDEGEALRGGDAVARADLEVLQLLFLRVC